MEKINLVPKNDLVFQRIFGKVGNEDIAKRFIELIIGKKIETIDLDVNRELIREKEEGKLSRLDVRAKLNDGISCNIEIQLKDQNNMEKRALYYWARLHGNQLKVGEDYKDVKKTISIIIMGENLKRLADIEEYHTKWKLREEKKKEKILTEDIEIHILEMEKMKNRVKEKDELRLWLLFLDNPENEEVLKEMEENDFFKQAMKEYEHLRGSEGFWRLVELREKNLRDEVWEKNNAREEGREEGIKEGTEKGKKDEKIAIAKKLLKKGYSVEQIMEITDLSEDEIKEIQ